jgi:hypothetical protein
VVRLQDTLCCVTQLVASGRLDTLGHGVCTVTPTGITVRTSSGEESFPLSEI